MISSKIYLDPDTSIRTHAELVVHVRSLMRQSRSLMNPLVTSSSYGAASKQLRYRHRGNIRKGFGRSLRIKVLVCKSIHESKL